MILDLPCVLVFFSGAAALIYEVVWTRLLMLALGAGAQSLALTVASTMLGLAAGSEFGGRLADRSASRLRLFGLIEIGVAAAAWAATALLRWNGPAAVLALIVFVPNLLMGATLPVLAAYVGRTGQKLRESLGSLYAANTAGAVLGTLAAGFWMVEHLGLSGSVDAAACINAAVGAVALLLKKEEAASHRETVSESMPKHAALALLGAAVSGFTVMAYEVLDTRFMIHGFHATTHAIAIILAAFIAGLSIGAAFFTARLGKTRAPIGELGLVLMAAAVLALVVGPALAQPIGGDAQSWGLRLATEALAAGLLLIPSTLVMGFAFPLSAASYVSSARAGGSTGRIFLVNTIFGAIGSLAAGFAILPAVGLRGALAIVVVIQAFCGAFLAYQEKSWPPLWRRSGWGLCAFLALAGAFWSQPPVLGISPGHGTLVPQHLAGHEQDYRVLCYREGRLATTEVVEELGTGFRTLFIDGFVTAGESATSNYMALMGRLPMLLHHEPKRVLVICLGGGATARAVAEWPQAAIDLVDINPDVFACAPSFGPANETLLARAHSFIEDGRRFLRREGPPYDVITQEPMPPYFAGTAALYSVEYYRLARRRLSDDGIMAQWLPLHLTAQRDARQIVAAALAVFPETWVAMAPGYETAIVISSVKPLDPARRRLAETELKAKFILDPRGCRRYVDDTEPVTDDRPQLEYSGVDRVRGRVASPDALAAVNMAMMISASLEHDPPRR